MAQAVNKSHHASNYQARPQALQWQAWTEWAGGRSIQSFPAAPDDVIRYLEILADNSWPLHHVQSMAHAIGRRHTMAGLPNPLNHPPLRPKLREIYDRCPLPLAGGFTGITREYLDIIKGSAVLPRAHKTRTETPAAAKNRGMREIALISLMRDAFLRTSEVLQVTWSQFVTYPDGTIYMLRTTMEEAVEDELWMQPRIGADTASALTHIYDGDEGRVFNKSERWVQTTIKQVARCAGLEGRFSGQSPRIGMAQDLMMAGGGVSDLMTRGPWLSPMMPIRYWAERELGRKVVTAHTPETAWSDIQ